MMTTISPTHSLTLKRHLKAPATRVYEAWTDPAKMMQWFAPADMGTPLAEADVRVGGRFRVLMREPDGAEHEVTGVYREVVPNEKLVFTWGWASEPGVESQVTVLFESVDGATDLTLIHEQLPTESSREGHNSGWVGALEKLKQLVA